MIRTAVYLLFVATLMSCANKSPEQNFSTAVLNCNMLYGFAGAGMQRELASPSEKLVDEKTYATAPMTRAEVLSSKLENIEKNYEKVKALSVNDDNKAMIEASLALYAFVLPVYKNDYTTLAALYDEGQAPEKIANLEKDIADNYAARFETLYNAVITAGQAYAARHNIKVQTVSPAP
jgi:hypothetical protein